MQIADREARLAPEEGGCFLKRKLPLQLRRAQLDKRQQELDALHQMLAQKVQEAPSGAQCAM